jgi:RNA polymerase sigma factor (sigma-70 family)
VEDYALNMFLQDIKCVKQLTKEQERALSKTIKECKCSLTLEDKCPECRKAINLFVMHNLPLVIKIAKNYKNANVPLPDLIGFGVYGVFIAASKYDGTKNVRFASYASFWIKDKILYALRACSGMPKIPTFLITKVRKVSRAMANDRSTSSEDISSHTNLPIDLVERLRLLLYQTVLLEDQGADLDEYKAKSPEDEYCGKERIALIEKMVNKLLPEQELFVMSHTYGLFGNEIMTLKEIGGRLDLGVEKIRQIRNNAVDLLRSSNVLKDLHEELGWE